MVRANVRLPHEVVSDFYAQAACNDAGGRALIETMDEFALDSFDPVAEEIIGRSEKAVRAAIAALEDGEWEGETWSDGFEEPILIKTKLEVRGDEIFIDFTGSSPQSRRGINVVMNYTHAYASFAAKAAIYPDVPHNEGSFRPVHVSAPAGSILNANEPAPVAARQTVGHFVPTAVFTALAKALPGKLMAPSADPIWLSVWRGQDPAFNLTVFQVGGTGARPTKDGLSAVGFPAAWPACPRRSSKACRRWSCAGASCGWIPAAPAPGAAASASSRSSPTVPMASGASTVFSTAPVTRPRGSWVAVRVSSASSSSTAASAPTPRPRPISTGTAASN